MLQHLSKFPITLLTTPQVLDSCLLCTATNVLCSAEWPVLGQIDCCATCCPWDAQ